MVSLLYFSQTQHSTPESQKNSSHIRAERLMKSSVTWCQLQSYLQMHIWWFYLYPRWIPWLLDIKFFILLWRNLGFLRSPFSMKDIGKNNHHATITFLFSYCYWKCLHLINMFPPSRLKMPFLWSWNETRNLGFQHHSLLKTNITNKQNWLICYKFRITTNRLQTQNEKDTREQGETGKLKCRYHD